MAFEIEFQSISNQTSLHDNLKKMNPDIPVTIQVSIDPEEIDTDIIPEMFEHYFNSKDYTVRNINKMDHMDHGSVNIDTDKGAIIIEWSLASYSGMGSKYL